MIKRRIKKLLRYIFIDKFENLRKFLLLLVRKNCLAKKRYKFDTATVAGDIYAIQLFGNLSFFKLRVIK